MRTILASASPRRKELLKLIVPEFEVIPAKEEERPVTGAPSHIVTELAKRKAQEVASHQGEEALVIAADTLVFLNGNALGKPTDEEDAKRMLTMLSGRAHEVVTGLAVTRGGVLTTDYECTRVRFCEMSEREIETYAATGDPMDKAGAYGIQSGASKFIEGIEGCYFNVVGLPVHRLYCMIKDMI